MDSDSTPVPAEPEAADRTGFYRSLIGSLNVGWAALVFAAYAINYVMTMNVEWGGLILLTCVPIQITVAVGFMRQRGHTSTGFALLALVQLAACASLIDDPDGIGILVLIFAIWPAALAAVVTRMSRFDAPVPATRRQRVVFVRDIIGGFNVALGAALTLLFAMFAVTNAAVALALIIILPAVLQTWSGARLIRDGGGVASLALVAGIELSFSAAIMFTENDAWVLLHAMPAAIGTVALLHPAFAPHLQPGGRGRWAARRLFVLAGALLCVWFTLQEGFAVKRMWDNHRREEQCKETGNLEACGRAALTKIRDANSFDEMREGRAELDRLCLEAANGKACRFAGYVRTRQYDDFYESAIPKLNDEVWARTTKLCKEGNADACAIGLEGARPDEFLDRTIELCKTDGGLPCVAWLRHDDDNEQARELACENGFVAACKQTPIPAIDRCLDGEPGACREVSIEQPAHPQADVFAAIAKVEHVHFDPGLTRVELPEREFTASCEEGSMIACIAAARALLVVEGSKPPSLPPRVELDRTLGRACDAGAALGCLVYGTWLLDRPLDAKRNVKHANQLLAQGCAAGSDDACRLREFGSDRVDQHREALRESCFRLNTDETCEPFFYAVRAKLELTPWSISDERGLPFFRAGCLDGDAISCSHLAWLHWSRNADQGSVPNFRYVANDAAQRSCRGGSSMGCGNVLSAADSWWPEERPALKEKICAQVDTGECHR